MVLRANQAYQKTQKNMNIRSSMDAFFYKNGNLHCEGVRISDISEGINTPFYLYSQSSMETQYKSLEKALRSLNHRIFFSAKANSNLSVLKIFKSLG